MGLKNILKNLTLSFEEKWKEIFNKHKSVLIWTGIFTFITHIYFFIRRLINEDMLGYLHTGPARPYSGRYFYGDMEVSLIPIVIFLIVFIELAITVIFILELFDIKDKIYSIIIGALVVTFPSWSCSFMYAFMWDTYSLSLLTAVLAIYLADKWKYGFLAGGFFIACSLSLYQSYIAVSMTLALIILLYEVCHKELKEVGIKAIKLFICGILGLILYKAGMWVFNIQLSDYKGIASMGAVPIDKIPELIGRTYKSFILFFTGGNFGVEGSSFSVMRFFNIPMFIAVVYIAYIIFTLRLLKLNMSKKLKAVNKIFAAVIIALLPLTVNLVDFIGVDTEANTLNTYAFVVIFILPFVLLSKYQMNTRGGGTLNVIFFTKRILIVLSFIIIFHNFWLNNAYYLKADYVMENTKSFVTRLISRFEQLDGFNKDTKFTIIYDNLDFKENPIGKKNNVFPIGGSYMTFPNLYEPGFTYRVVGFKGKDNAAFAMEKLMRNLAGAEFKAASKEEMEEIKKTDEYKSMEAYPAKTSVKMINGIAVVNFIERGK